MKKFVLGTVGLIALGTASASAADMAARPYTKAPPMVAAAYDWSGFYAGINGGWGSSRNSWFQTDPAFTVGPEGAHDSSGGTVGGQIGYRWQAGTFVFGLEAQGNWADFTGSNISLLFGDINNSKVEAFGLFTGQVGYAVNNVLLYVKGGAAVTSNKYRITDAVTGAAFGITGDDTRWGASVGVGLEYAFAPNWSVGVEYNHLFMQDRTVNFVDPATGAAFGTDRISQDVDLVTARLNYKFGGPMVSRY